MILANIYAPNHDDEGFIPSVLSSFPNLHSHRLILSGDFNFVLNPLLDRSSNKQQTLTNSAKLILNFLNTANLKDPWRHLHPSQRIYSFFSQPHHSFSKIDYFLIDSKLMPVVKSVQYEASMLSKHAPLILQLVFLSKHTSRTWWMDNRLLSDESTTEYIKYHIGFYLATNDTPDILDRCYGKQ